MAIEEILINKKIKEFTRQGTYIKVSLPPFLYQIAFCFSNY